MKRSLTRGAALKPTRSPCNDNDETAQVIEYPGDRGEWVKLMALGMVTGGLQALQQVRASALGCVAPQPSNTSDTIMCADEVAAYLGVDRNTVYEYAARGVIPHKRLGKRMIFRRGSIIAWLDTAVGGGEQ